MTARDGLTTEARHAHIVNPRLVRKVRDRMKPEETMAMLAETFRALGDPARAKILFALLQAELCVCDLAEIVGASESAVSHQLRILRALRLVRSRRDGRQVYYSLADEHIRTLIGDGLDHVEELI